jgi:hypothetical protein
MEEGYHRKIYIIHEHLTDNYIYYAPAIEYVCMFRDRLDPLDKADSLRLEEEDFGSPSPYPIFHDTDEVITIQEMRLALRAVLGGKGINGADTDKLADYLMNFFGFDDYIIDNILDAEDRDVFYTLEEEGLLRTEREEIYLLKGKMWRIHYWILRKREILALARDKAEVPEKKPDTLVSLYDQVGEEVWASRSNEDLPGNSLH